jgi:N-acyl-D-amino-acid deacylase
VDGTGSPWHRADVYVEDGLIKRVGRLGDISAEVVIDATDRVVSPGFIDSHTHSDITAILLNKADGHLVQGVTTEIAGMCGNTPAPVLPETRNLHEEYTYGSLVAQQHRNLLASWSSTAEWMTLINHLGLSNDMAVFVGHGCIRTAVMGFDPSKPTPGQMEQMKELLRQSMSAGALGMSAGLIYPPGCFSDTEELIELCTVVAEYGGMYCVHLRSEGDGLVEAVKETIQIGRQAGCPVHISHHKVCGIQNYGTVVSTLALMEQARLEGIDVTCDAYPYVASETALSSLLPPWVHNGGELQLKEALRDISKRSRLKVELTKSISGWENLLKGSSYDSIVITSTAKKDYEGRTIAALAAERGCDPADFLLDAVADEGSSIRCILFVSSEQDNAYVLKHRLTMIGSDSVNAPTFYTDALGMLHPRAFGTFPRILGQLCRDDAVLTMEEAVHKMTGFPAARFGLHDRGIIRTGMIADLVIFDEQRIQDRATYRDPFQRPEGIDYVIKNGEVVVENNLYNGKTLGKVISR